MLRLTIVLVLGLFLAAFPAAAQMIEVSLDARTDAATLIVEARVVESTPFWNPDGTRILTANRLEVLKVFKMSGMRLDEIVEIENLEVSGDNAKIVLRRLARGKSRNHQAFGILLVVALFNGVGMLVNYLQGRLAHWEGVVGFLVLVALIWFAFYVRRRSYYEESRAQETWRLIDGRWLLVEEQQL